MVCTRASAQEELFGGAAYPVVWVQVKPHTSGFLGFLDFMSSVGVDAAELCYP